MTDTIVSGSQRLGLIGGGEHARVVLDAAQRSGWDVAGCWSLGAVKPGLRHLGDDEDLLGMAKDMRDAMQFHLAMVGKPGSKIRQQCTAWGDELGLRWATIVHPSAVLGWGVEVGVGCFISAQAVLNAFVRLEDHVVVNTGAVVEHDVEIGRGAHIAPRAVIGGGARIRAYATVGLGASIRDHITIGEGAVVGMGAVVLGDVPDGAWVGGNPAKPFDPKG